MESKGPPLWCTWDLRGPRCAESGRLWCELCGQPGGVLSGKPRMNPWLNMLLLYGFCMGLVNVETEHHISCETPWKSSEEILNVSKIIIFCTPIFWSFSKV